MSGLAGGVIYLVESHEDPSALIAIDARVHDGLVEWFDTVHDRCFDVLSIEESERGVVVRTPRGSYLFRLLTLELYKDVVMDRLGSPRMFISTAELQDFYRAFPR